MTLYLTKKENKIAFRCYDYKSNVLRFSRKALKDRLIDKELDDDNQTDDELHKDAIDFMFERLEKGIKRFAQDKLRIGLFI